MQLWVSVYPPLALIDPSSSRLRSRLAPGLSFWKVESRKVFAIRETSIARLATQAFKCSICMSTVRPPIIMMSKCCLSLTGCTQCVAAVKDWINRCPLCRANETNELCDFDEINKELARCNRTEEDHPYNIPDDNSDEDDFIVLH